MSTAFRRTASATGSAALVGASLLFDGAVAQAGPELDNTDPIATGCSNTGRVVEHEPLRNTNGNGQVQGTIYLFYSSACRTVWAKIVTDGPNCQSNGVWCGNAYVIRDRDGRVLGRPTPVGGTTAYTKQLNDIDVTSYALGNLTTQSSGYFNKTESF